jgi:hypothetical protein
MSGPNKKATTLGERAESMERWSLRAGLVVVIGLLVESGPELAHSLIYLEWPSLGVVGNVVVVLGVAGEVLFSWRAVRAARKAELEAEQTVVTLQARIAEADERTANLRIAVADALERQATAEQLLADLRLDQGPRAAIFDKLKFAGALDLGPKSAVEIMYPTEDAEAWALAKAMTTSFMLAHWNTINSPVPIPEHPFLTEPATFSVGASPVGITVRANSGVNEGAFKAVVDAFEVLAARGGTQFKVVATTDIDLPSGVVRVIVAPKF